MQRAGARDEHGQAMLVDGYGSPLTFRWGGDGMGWEGMGGGPGRLEGC